MQERGTVSISQGVVPAIGTDCEVGCGERAIAFAAIVGRLAGTGVAAIEQPLTESDAVGAGAIAEEAIAEHQKMETRLLGIVCQAGRNRW